MSSPVFPIALRANERRAVIVGGGSVARRKARSLLAAGFHILVVAPRIHEDLRARASASDVALLERPYEPADVHDAALAIAATGDDAIDARVVADARALGILVCDASAPERGDFTMLATLRLGDLTIAIESGGASPTFSLRMLREIEAHFGPSYAAAARTLARMRKHIRATLPKEWRPDVMRVLSELPVDVLANMNITKVVCASRASALATTQARTIAALVARRGIATEILEVTTAGDRDRERPLHALGETNVFVTELEAALRERRADYAVHSCKDLPSELTADMTIAAISVREDPRDAFCSERYERFEELPPGAVVGTSSLRRRYQLESLRPDLRYVDVRGNVDTRLRKLRDGAYDAIVLAMAGLNRLRTRSTHVVAFSIEHLVPAAAQGALAVEVRAGEAALAHELHAAVNDAAAERCVRLERAALRALRAGCSAPIGIHAREHGGRIVADAAYAVAGSILRERIEDAVSTPQEAQTLGEALAQRLAARVAALAEPIL